MSEWIWSRSLVLRFVFQVFAMFFFLPLLWFRVCLDFPMITRWYCVKQKGFNHPKWTQTRHRLVSTLKSFDCFHWYFPVNILRIYLQIAIKNMRLTSNQSLLQPIYILKSRRRCYFQTLLTFHTCNREKWDLFPGQKSRTLLRSHLQRAPNSRSLTVGR